MSRILLALLPALIGAAPFFHDIPDTSKCPMLCTTDRTLCPGGTGSCAGNQTLCNDGACYDDATACEGIKNKCDCGGNKQDRLGHGQVPCRTVNGDYFAPVTMDEFCLAAYSVTTKEELTPGGVINLACLAKAVPDGTEPLFLAFYGGWGGFGLLNVAWYMFKTSGEKDFVKADPNAEEIVTGFAPHAFGSVLYYLFILLTMTWPVLFVWIDYEYYVSYAAFFAGSYRQLDLMLIGCWHTAAIWFPFAKFVSPLLGNYYSQRVPLSKCQTVAVWQRADDQILLEDNSRATQLVRNFNKAVQSLTGVPGYTTTNTVCTSSANTRYFDYHCARHSFVAGKGGVEGGSFQSAASTVSSDSAELLSLKSGLDSATASKELERTGENFIRVVVPNVLSAIAEEYTSYFCIYQFMILVVFLYWSYWYMGIVHGGIISLSLGIKVILKRGSKLRVKAMAESRVPCSVLRDGKWAVMDSTRLVPRDVVCVEEGMKVPADMVMISGNCILDEAMLTGEAMPVQKFTIASDGKPYKKMGAGKKYTLFAGTKVLDTQAAPGQTRAIALVVDVGAHTEKGKLVSGILYTPPVSFVFDEHLKVVFGLLACWALVALLIVSNIAGTTGTTTWLYAVFTVSQVFPPILPAVLVIGQSTSAARLRAQSIFCVDLPRITIAGKVRVFCFDKTGTLTQEGLEFNGLLPVEQQQEKGEAPKFAEMMKENLQPLLSAAIGCAHTVSKLGSRFVGNPVDVEMFSKSGWALQPKDDGAVYTKDGQVIKVLKQHEFDHASMSMAVVVQINDQVHIFVKGSFEAIHNLCDAKTLPANYMDEAQGLAANGCYTLGVAHRCLGSIDAAAARAMPRDEVERGNACLALLTFRNNLKPDTAAAIAVLQAGDVRPVMITGDTAMTGIFIARKCNMVPVTATVLLGELRHKNAENAEDIIWTPNDIKWTLVDSVTGTLGREVPIETVMAQLNDTIAITVGDNVDAKTPLVLGSKYELAMTGSVFNVLTTEGNLIKQLLPICRVFARMTPVDKVTCVELHMATDITAMCGDGGNDCGALRAAHVGVAMSEGEASIVSPFSTSDKSVFAAITVLREGRCCLSTSFYAYDFVLMYGETVVLSKLFYLYISCQLAEWVWILFEGMLVPLISISLAQAKPLSVLVPRRPTARLLGLETFATVVGICMINFFFMVGAFFLLFAQDFFLCNEWDASKVDLSKWWLLADNFEGCLVGLLVMSQIINAGAVGNFSAGYRQNWLKNWAFILVFLAAYTLVSCLLLLDPNPVGCYFRFNCGDPDVLVSLGYLGSAEGVDWTGPKYNNLIGHNVLPPYFRTYVWFYMMGNLAVVFLYVRVIVIGPVRSFLRANYGSKANKAKVL